VNLTYYSYFKDFSVNLGLLNGVWEGMERMGNAWGTHGEHITHVKGHGEHNWEQWEHHG
jgi:hypothetical protein